MKEYGLCGRPNPSSFDLKSRRESYLAIRIVFNAHQTKKSQARTEEGGKLPSVGVVGGKRQKRAYKA